MTRKVGPMDIDYHRRCIKQQNGKGFDVIYYGLTYAEYVGPSKDRVYDITENFKDKHGSGRTAVMYEEKPSQFFFTKDLKRETVDDNFRSKGDLQGGVDAVRVGARDARGGKSVTEEIAPRERGSGSGAGGSCTYDYEEENCPGHVASLDDSKVCDRCGIHIDSLRPDDEEFDYE